LDWKRSPRAFTLSATRHNQKELKAEMQMLPHLPALQNAELCDKPVLGVMAAVRVLVVSAEKVLGPEGMEVGFNSA
jgi:hypothetical protein